MHRLWWSCLCKVLSGLPVGWLGLRLRGVSGGALTDGEVRSGLGWDCCVVWGEVASLDGLGPGAGCSWFAEEESLDGVYANVL